METLPSEAHRQSRRKPVSEYPGRNLRERRSSLVKDENHWPSLSILGEGKIQI